MKHLLVMITLLTVGFCCWGLVADIQSRPFQRQMKRNSVSVSPITGHDVVCRDFAAGRLTFVIPARGSCENTKLRIYLDDIEIVSPNLEFVVDVGDLGGPWVERQVEVPDGQACVRLESENFENCMDEILITPAGDVPLGNTLMPQVSAFAFGVSAVSSVLAMTIWGGRFRKKL